jgi:protein TonB
VRILASHWRNPKYDLREESRKVMDQALSLSLGLVILVLLTSRDFGPRTPEPVGELQMIEVEDMPGIDQPPMPSAPARPQIPIATLSEDVPEDVTIFDTLLDTDIPASPSWAYSNIRAANRGTSGGNSLIWDDPPQLIRMVTPVYPDRARKAGVDGRVDFIILVDEKGDVVEADVVAATPAGYFEQAAREAVLNWKYKPARLRNRAVRARLNQSVYFSFNNIPPLPDR